MPSYINHKNIPALRAFFPNMRIEELDAGHWGMFPNPALDSVAEFFMLF